MAARCSRGAAKVQTKLGDRSRCCGGEHKCYFVNTAPQPRAGMWHRHRAEDECFLSLRSPFRGQHSPGCSEQHSGALRVNPLSAHSNIPQLVLSACSVSHCQLLIPNSPPLYHNRNSPWQFSCLGCPDFGNHACDEIFLVKLSSRGTTWSPWPAPGEPLPCSDSPSRGRGA